MIELHLERGKQTRRDPCLGRCKIALAPAAKQIPRSR